MVVHRIAPAPPLPTARLGEENVPDWTDHELLAALAAHDPRAGLVLYDRLIRVVEWTILRVTGQRCPDHEDLVQGAFEQIVSTLYKQRYAQDCSLTSWASAIGCHVALNALRAQGRQRALRAESLSRHSDTPPRTDVENQVAARQALESIRIELASMNASRAEVLVLHEINGLELPEIARVLGISISAAQSRLSRGRRELLERLASRSKAGGAS
jgi:RNA polymerase sigma-70 factor (ECF subfamily)